MFWQLDLLPPEPVPAFAVWLPEKLVPAKREPQKPPEAHSSDTRSVPEEDLVFIEMTEAILRLVANYPGVIEKCAEAIQIKPGQSRQEHFDRMMAAFTARAPYHAGMGKAIADTLSPFVSKDASWR